MSATEPRFLLWGTWCWCYKPTPLQNVKLSALGSSAVSNSAEVLTYPGQAISSLGRAQGLRRVVIPVLLGLPSKAVMFWCPAISSLPVCSVRSWNYQSSFPAQETHKTPQKQQSVLYTVSRSYKALKEITIVITRSTILNIYFVRFNSVLPNISGTWYVLTLPYLVQLK